MSNKDFGSFFHRNSAEAKADRAAKQKIRRRKARARADARAMETWARGGFLSGRQHDDENGEEKDGGSTG